MAPIPTRAADRKRIAQQHKTTVAGQAMRDLVAYELSLQGLGPTAIAKQDGRAPKTIETVLRKMRANGAESMLQLAPIAIIESMLRRSQMAWRMAATTAAHAESDAGRTAAVRVMLDADERVLEILQSTGHLPRELGTLRHLVDVRHIAIQMIDAVRDLESGERSPAEVRGVFEELLAITEGGT